MLRGRSKNRTEAEPKPNRSRTEAEPKPNQNRTETGSKPNQKRIKSRKVFASACDSAHAQIEKCKSRRTNRTIATESFKILTPQENRTAENAHLPALPSPKSLFPICRLICFTAPVLQQQTLGGP